VTRSTTAEVFVQIDARRGKEVDELSGLNEFVGTARSEF